MIRVIGVLHTLFAVFMCLYGFLIPRNAFDWVYLFIHFSIFLSWTCFNGECFLSLWFKQRKDPKYKAGYVPSNLVDMHQLVSPSILKKSTTIGCFINIISVVIVLYRQGLPWWFINLCIAAHIIYTMSLRYWSTSNLIENVYFQRLQRMVCFIQLLLCVYLVCFFFQRYHLICKKQKKKRRRTRYSIK